MKLGIFIVIAVLLLGGLFFLLSPKPQVVQREVKGNAVTAAPTKPVSSEKTVSLDIKNNELVSGDTIITLTEGETANITVTSDSADELHIHGYDKEVELAVNTPAKITLHATLTGRFPIELHGADVEIAVLEVQPN